MSLKAIKAETEYRKALKRAMEIFHAEPGTAQDDELGVLLLRIKDYEDSTVKMPEVVTGTGHPETKRKTR
jgi:HTH-type transcriptional regulator/antitoxin HigA